MGLPQSCAVCTMHRAEGELCRRHAPGPATVRHEPAKWPQREPSSRCAEGSTDRVPIACGACFYWWQPDGKPITPKVAAAHRAAIWAPKDTDWWDNTGLCVHHTAHPGGKTEMYHPRVTHGALDGCGTGETPEQVIKRTTKG